MRPGERLHEVLLSANETFAAPGSAAEDGLRLVHSRRDPRRLDQLSSVVEELRALVDAGDGPRLRARALAAARDLQ
jgi:FlaA1/EpsC-like NDP-sugar epimerase